jgi:predicted PurR-regulated permease PerM
MAPTEDRIFSYRAVETSIRIGLIALLAISCFQVVRPFVQPIVWGIILAIAVHPIYARLVHALGGREKLSAVILVLGSLLLLIVPLMMITAGLVESAGELASKLHEGEIDVPPPPVAVADWPIFGGRLHDLWATASQSLEAALHQVIPHLAAGQRALSAGLGIAMFALSIVIAGVLLSYGDRATNGARKVARRLTPERGDELVALIGATVQSVTRGILGVASIQAFLAGIGMLAVGLPLAGVWALLVFLAAVVQIPALLVLGPIIVYVFATSSTIVAVLFCVWALAVSLSDNVLKPILLGRGVDVPVLVIFVGAIGGFILGGIIGLFVGAVLLAVGYTLFNAWVEQVPIE